MKRNILAMSATASVAAASFVGLAATSADAATTAPIKPNSFISALTGLHNAPSTQAPAVTTIKAGTPVQALCFGLKGEIIDGNEHWFRIAVDENTSGWVPREVIGGVPDLGKC